MYRFIVNPNSRSGKSRELWEKLKDRLDREQVPYTAYLTEYAGHARRLVETLSARREPDTLVVLGGDGTLNEVINGLSVSAPLTLAYIPSGSGNDFSRGMGIPRRPEKALERMREEMETLTARYRTLRENMLESSPVYKKLHQLAKQKKPQNTQTLISEELWEQIKQQAQKVYPGLRRYVINRCPDLNESEWAYCCLYLFGFDTNDEALLLGINTSSVRTKTLRLRTRLNIDLPAQMSLYEYITMQI